MGILAGRRSCLGQKPVEYASFRGIKNMAKDDKPLNDEAREGAGGKVKSTERPFDLWLQKQLHAMYDEIASEPLPEDLLKLIDRDAEARKAPDPGNDKK